MNGIHDLGGMHGFGPVEREENEPVFHAPWEAAMLAVQRAMTRGGVCTIDEFRHAVERMDPVRYLRSSYYERWLDGVCRVLVEKGVLEAGTLDARTAREAERPDDPAGASATRPAAPVNDEAPPPEPSFRREPARLPRFSRGDTVLTRNEHPAGHTRLPRYARGKRGVVTAHYGTQVFPDAVVQGRGEQPQPLYCVRFSARELWGPAASPNDSVLLDLWESYLLPG